jgi:hypothetical protein
MSSIYDYVQVTVTRGTRPIETAGFGIPLFLADTHPFGAAPERTRTYGSTTEMVDDGFATTDPAYLFAEKLFGQTNRPNDVVVARKDGVETVTEALNLAALENNNWFFLACETQADADILLAAAYAEANDKMYFVSVPLSTVGAAPTTDIASQLKALQYSNTQTITVNDADLTDYAEGALIGAMAATNPGTSAWFAMTLVGVPAVSFTSTEEANIKAKNSNFYPLVAGVGFYTDGKQAGGDFGDTIRFSLWLKARIAEAVFGLMKRKSDLGLKIPYSETGFQMIRNIIYGDVIGVAVARGAVLTKDDGAEDPIVSTPARSEIPANDIANRLLPDVKVEVVFSGAIQTVVIKAYVVL